MDETALELAKLASELDTIKLLGVILTFAFIAIITLVVMISRNTRSQDKQNATTVTGIFGITGKLVSTLENLDTTLRTLSSDFTKSVKELEFMRIEQDSLKNEQRKQNKIQNAFMIQMLDTDQMKAIMDRTDIPIPDMSKEDNDNG